MIDHHHPRLQGNIIVVDDNQSDLSLLVEILTKNGYNVRPHLDDPSALPGVWIEPPTLILLNVDMPQMDGYEVCRQLKTDERTANIPVILISATDEVFNRVKLFAAGGVDYITKPFQVEEVLAIVEMHLSLYTMQQRLEVQNTLLQQEITEHKQTKTELQRHREHLEELVEARTAELEVTNEQLLQEIAALRQTEKTLQMTRFTVESVADTMFWMDSEARIIDVNKAACDTLGYTRQELLTMSLFDIDPDFTSDRWHTAWNQLKETGKLTRETTHRTKDGRIIPVEIAANYLEFGGRELDCAFARDISERKRAEEALQESEFFLRKSQAVAQIGSYYFDVKTGKWIGSPVLDEIFGIDNSYPKDVEGWIGLVHPEYREEMHQYLSQYVLVEHNRFDKEYRIIRHDNQQERWVHGLGELEFDEHGNTIKMIGTIQDITERRQAEEALRLTQLAVDRARDAIHWVGPNGELLYVNEAMCQSLGYTREELLSMTVFDIDPRYTEEMWADHWEDERDLGHYMFESVHRTKDGRIFPVEIVLDRVTYGGKEFNCVYARDITQRKQVEAALRESEGRLQRAELLARIGHYAFDADLGNPIISDGLKEIWGFERGSNPDVSQILARLHPDDQWVLTEMEKAAEEMRGFDIEYRIVHPDGSEVIVHSSAEISPNEPGHSPRFFGTMVDITDRKQAEEALRENEERLRQAIRVSRTGMFDHDHLTDTIYWSPEQREIYGWGPEETVTLSKFLSQIYPEDGERIEEAVQRAHDPASDGLFDVEHRIIRRDGAVRWISTRSQTFFEGEGSERHPVRTVGATLDITEAKLAEEAQAKLEEQLRQAQKLESIGQLAGGIAHDFNNLLLPIIGYAELSQMELSPSSKLYTDLEKIKTAAERAASLTRQILAFSRRQVLEVQVFDLNEVITGFQEMLRRLITEDIDVQIFLAPTPCLLQADRAQIEQLLLNLSVNARDAMPDGGKFIIETANVYLDEAYTQTHSETEPGHYVMLSLSDTGHGIDDDTQQHIFEPFFTTKEQGKGTGLGLAMVFGIVKQHQGNIWVYSEPGQGTTFKIYLPRSEETTQLAATTIPDPTSIYGTETVVVVEDEPMVRKLACETLEAYGYTVIEAESPDDGLQLVSSYEGTIHLLLTDVIMPDMNGRELYEKLAVIRPDLKVLYMSGYTDNVIVHHGVLDERVNFLQKPFTARSLIQKVRRVLD